MSNLNEIPEKVKKRLDAVIDDVSCFESEHGARGFVTEAPIEGEAELYRSLRRLKREYANALDIENDQHIEAISEWASASTHYYDRTCYQSMSFRQQSDLVRQAIRKRKAAAKTVRDMEAVPDKLLGPEYIEAQAALARAERETSVLYYWHLIYLVHPHFPDKLPTHEPLCFDALKREYVKNSGRRDAYAATDLHTIENATTYLVMSEVPNVH